MGEENSYAGKVASIFLAQIIRTQSNQNTSLHANMIFQSMVHASTNVEAKCIISGMKTVPKLFRITKQRKYNNAVPKTSRETRWVRNVYTYFPAKKSRMGRFFGKFLQCLY